MIIIPTCFFRQYRQGWCLSRYSRTKKLLSRLYKQELQKVIFYKGLTLGFRPKIAIFFNFFFLGNIGKENVFHNILERKNSLLAYKKKKFKNSKNWHFSNGVNPWFWSKNGHFFKLFFLGNIGKENVFHDILKRKNSFLAYKNKKLKKSKNWRLYKGVNLWFLSKHGHFFQLFFCRQYKEGKCLSRYSRTKKLHSRLKKPEVQKVKKLTFFQRG